MTKKFAPRVSKKQRKTLDYLDRVDVSVLKKSDEKLLQGAKLNDVELKQITVKEQVRTKFNDKSIKELADNIEANGLIQPLVVHRQGSKYTLICGERRFRAMTLIKKKKASCFVLENKTPEELMAIQFSENSSREELHWIDKADGILNYQIATKASERTIVKALGISKSEVHRSLLIAKLPKKIKEAAKVHNTEKYVLLEFDALAKGALRTKLQKLIVEGKVVKRSELKKLIKEGGVIKASKRKSASLPKGLSANAFLKALQTKSKSLKVDKETKALINSLVEETRDIVDI
jgi:ParB family chromosome partitioning protein